MKDKAALHFLNEYLLAEYESHGQGDLAVRLQAQCADEHLFRALLNVRPPRPISEAFITQQDAYLQKVHAARTSVTVQDFHPTAEGFYLWQGDITRLAVDAIVNAANSQLLGCFAPLHNCIDNIIHTYAGVQLRLECHEIMQKQGHGEPTGKAKITSAYNLPSKHVIHTVGPIIRASLSQKDEELLASAYFSCLQCAVDNNLQSIAFCCISTGEFCFPQDIAAQIATTCVRDFLAETKSDLSVVFNVFKDEDYEIYRRLLGPDCYPKS